MVRFTSSKDENVTQQPLNCPITFLTLKAQGQGQSFLAVTLPQMFPFISSKDQNLQSL